VVTLQSGSGANNNQVTVLPVRLFIDQDALDFITRFFEFKDEDADNEPKPGNGPFIQRLEVTMVPVKMDYKPKKVDYAGLRSGHTSEFMNFFVLDGAGFCLKKVICYGIVAPDRVQKMLKDLWTEDITTNQLPTVLAGLASVRPLVDVTSGLQNLVLVPMREYKKDGRILRSAQKGFVSFAKQTSIGLTRLGAGLAIGTQNIAEGLETQFTGSSSQRRRSGADWDDDEVSSSSPSGRDEAKAVSNYANQPLNVVTGVKTAFTGLERDIATAKNAIIAMGAEIRESDSATGAAGAILRRAPPIVLRPIIGTSKAIGTVLSGAHNQLDKDSQRRMKDVSGLHTPRSTRLVLIFF
jgi:autophagy-related protein 2